MKEESFELTEYDEYVDNKKYKGRHELGTVSFEDEVTSFSVHKPWLVLKFQVYNRRMKFIRLPSYTPDYESSISINKGLGPKFNV